MLYPDHSVETQTNGSAAIRKAAGIERVVFALERESREQIGSQFYADRLPGAECHWVDVAGHDPESWEKMLFDLEPTVLVTGWDSPAIPAGFARSPEMSLRYVCHLTGSVRQIVPRSLIERGVLVSNWGTLASRAVAEHAVLLVLASLRQLPAWENHMAQWPRLRPPMIHFPLETRTLHGKRVGLHGFGSIARELVKMLAPFGVEMAAYSAGVPDELFKHHGVQRHQSLHELFSTSDVLIECEALTARTKESVNAQVLQALPAGAVFVNVGRGHVVDESALARIAVEKNLRLGLDVYQKEPLPAESPLRTLPGALLSPHIAGPTKDGFADLCELAFSNIRRHLLNERIEAEISLEAYDRAT